MENRYVIPVMSLVVALIAIGAFLLSFDQSSTPQASGKLRVVAAENFWGSLATQLGGDRVNVTSIVTDPNADPHEYESSTVTARSFAQANYVVLNGAGYDSWAVKLIDANPSTNRRVFTVADLLGKKPGDNPHFWYGPDYVLRVVDKITSDYQAVDPADSAYFAAQRTHVLAAFQPYEERIASINAKYAGTNVAATEDIVQYLTDATGLKLISPSDFMESVAEGSDPSTASALVFEQQLVSGQPRVLMYNVQTSTAVTTNVKQIAEAHGIPVVGVSETIEPSAASFQDWMVSQLDAVETALKQ